MTAECEAPYCYQPAVATGCCRRHYWQRRNLGEDAWLALCLRVELHVARRRAQLELAYLRGEPRPDSWEEAEVAAHG